MARIEIEGKSCTEAQLGREVGTWVRENGGRPIVDIFKNPPRSPALKALVGVVGDDSLARMAAAQKLQRGVAGCGPLTATLDVACFLIDLYQRVKRRR